MKRALAVVPMIVVAVAAGVMIWLGFWQISRAGEKEALLARFKAAESLPPTAYPTRRGTELPLFRRVQASCAQPAAGRVVAGRNPAGEVGYVYIVDCRTAPAAPPLSVQIGWSRNPGLKPDWQGGEVQGMLAPDSRSGARIIASQPAAGLQPSAGPSIEDIPNNHRSYAVQWFLFAGLSVLIFVLAARGRRKAKAQGQ